MGTEVTQRPGDKQTEGEGAQSHRGTGGADRKVVSQELRQELRQQKL